MSKQRVNYRPQIKYTADYQTNGKPVNQQNIMIGPQSSKEPLDTTIIPNIEENLIYLDSAIKALPLDLSRALREVYDPIREIFYTTLIDKIVDPNPQTPEIIFKPGVPGDIPSTPDENTDKEPGDNDNDNDNDETDKEEDKEDEDKNIFPIILHPIDYGNKDDEGDVDRSEIHPIILKPVEGADSGDNDNDNDNDDIEAPFPIILHPIPGADIEKPDNGGGDGNNGNGDDGWDDENGLWEEPGVDVEYLYPDLSTSVDKEFVYLLSKLLKHYTDSLKDIINNYFFNSIRQTLGQSEENIKFISNSLAINSNDILNHSKHLLDASVKNENMAALRTQFFKNSFNIKGTTTHVRSFFVSYELRKRYTTINYSKGKSMTNAMSDSLLKQLNAKYELQFRKSFENFFRYLESSLRITDDVLNLHIQNGLSKSVIIKKGGIR